MVENDGLAIVLACKRGMGIFDFQFADVAEILRIAVTGMPNSPDLCTICKLLGENVVKSRINAAAK